MKKIIPFFSVIIIFFNCQDNKKAYKFIDTFPKYFINKDSLRIIEIDSNVINHYIFKDSKKTKIAENFISFSQYNKDSILLILPDSIEYKSIDINTEGNVNLIASEFWTLHFEDRQDWYSFKENIEGEENGKVYFYNEYSSYSAFKNEDTIQGQTRDYIRYEYFDKFSFIDFGPNGFDFCLLSPKGKDSIKVDAIKILDKTNNIPPLYLSKYKSKKKQSYIGDWKLQNKSNCDYDLVLIGNKLRIDNEYLKFSNNTKTLTTLSYEIGLDSKFINLKSEENNVGIGLFWGIKILKQNKSFLHLEVDHGGNPCREMDTLIYTRINPQK